MGHLRRPVADGSSGEDEAEKRRTPETQEMAPAGRELQASLEEGSGESAAEAEEEEDEDEEIRETGTAWSKREPSPS